MDEVEYAGFWLRVGASLIDTILILFITVPVTLWIYGDEYALQPGLGGSILDILLNYVFPVVAIIAFWVYKSATPGKMALNLIIVDARTGGKPSTGQFIGRYFAYYLSTIVLFLGFIWVGIDKRKQGWHDKLAGTVVIKNTARER